MGLTDMIDVESYDVLKLTAWTVADLSAVLWGYSTVTSFDVRSALGGASDTVLIGVGILGLVSLILTWTDIGPEVR